MSDEQKKPEATFTLRLMRGNVFDIQYSGDATPEALDIAIEALQSFKRAYCPEPIAEPAPTSEP